MHFRISNVISLSALLLLSGCAVINGKVTDANTGESLEDVRVGIMEPPSLAPPVFRELMRTDENGEYTLAWFRDRTEVSVRADGYVSVKDDLANRVGGPWDIALQPLAPIGGTWEVTMNNDRGHVLATEWDFGANSVVWRHDDRPVAFGHYTFDGTTITIDDNISTGDIAYGRMFATLHFNAEDGSLTGHIELSGIYQYLENWGGSTGTVVAVRQAP